MVLNIVYSLIDNRPVETLSFMFTIIWIYEGLARGLWILTPLVFVITFFISVLLAMALKVVFKENRGLKIKSIMDYRRPSAHVMIGTTLSVVAMGLDSTLVLPLSILVMFVSWERVRVKAHTVKEVVEGVVYGTILGLVLDFVFFYLVI